MKMISENFPESLGGYTKGLKACIQAFELAVPIDRVVLFGSYARGQNRPDSDVDLCIIVSGMISQQKTSRTLRRTIGRIRNKPALSLVPISVKRLAEKHRIHDPFYETIMREGVCLAKKD